MRKIKLITLFLILFILTLIPLNTVNAEGTKRVMTQIMTDSNGNYFYWPSSLSFPYGVRIKEILQNEIIEAKWTTADGQKVRKYVFDFSFRTDGTIGYYKKYKSKIENSIFTDIISEKPVQETTPLFFEDGYPVEYVMENYHVGSKDKFDIKYNDKISYDYYGTVYYWQHHWIDENTRSRFLANDSYATDLDNSYGESGEIRIEIALIGDEDLTLFDVPKKVDGLNMVVQLDDGTYVTVDANGNVNTDSSYEGIVEDENGIITQIQENLPVPEVLEDINKEQQQENDSDNKDKKGIIAGIVGVIAGAGVAGASSSNSSNSNKGSNNSKKDFSKYGYYQDKDKNWWRTIYNQDGDRVSFRYDQDGNLTGGSRDEGKGRYSIIEYELDENKNIKYQRETLFDKNGNEKKYTEIKYNGNNKERNTYSNSDKKQLMEKSNFNKDGLTNQELFDKDGNIRQKVNYTKETEHSGSNVVNSSITEQEVRYTEIYENGQKVESHRVETGDKTTIFRYIGK